MPEPRSTPMPLRGSLAALAGGLAASLAMNQFQKLWATALPTSEGDEPATVKASRKSSRAAPGSYFKKRDKEAAGSAVHYLFGGGLGMI